MQSSRFDLESITETIKSKIQHCYLNRYIDRPVIDHNKLFILSSILNETILSEKVKKKYLVTVMLVQIALDTHDLVPETNKRHEHKGSKETKQLTVLAGDYYSGLYYFLLSEIDDFKMIKKLAATIKEINEYKMQLYYREPNSLDDAISLVKQIESALMVRVAEFVQETRIGAIASDWLLVGRLKDEIAIAKEAGSSTIVDIGKDLLQDKNDISIIQKLESIIETKQSQLKIKIEQATLDPYVKENMGSIFRHRSTTKTSIVEEG
ncbi:heptaprenyl diphosphate synthase component 1 [Oceanobacillus halotolerans]|uniref:heptaprenyl diphosphate synthase component 1 n=1 Tax=Oceanobacillus halotolerans TaxID=2663380 RepID=UPI0013D94E20|nr:heptaprenyl diphosphate synthase component 1 [Oceanobacillus halotolerans]